MKLSNITIQGFRGFNETQSLPLDSDIVIIYGLNGAGKSSFTEALEWLFFGEISRQRLSRCKSEYQYEEYLKNLFYSSKDNPFVEVEGTINNIAIKIKKEIAPGKDKFYVNDKEVADLSGLGLKLESYFRPMLAQTEIKALVDSEQKDRWEQLSSILGQDDLTRLRENIMNLRNTKRNEDFKKQELKLQTILNDIEDSLDLLPLKQAVQVLDTDALLKEINKITIASSVNMKEVSEVVKNKQKSLLNTELGKRVAEVTYNTAEDLTKYIKELKDKLTELEEQCKKFALSGQDYNYVEFIKLGKNLAQLPACPFCNEQTLTEERMDQIEKSLDLSKEAQAGKARFSEIKIEVETWLKGFEEKIKTFLPLQKELKIIAQKFLDINENELAVTVQEVEKNVSALLLDIIKKLKTTSANCIKNIDKKYFHNQSVEELNTVFNTLIQEIIGLQSDQVFKWEEVKVKIAEKVPLSGELNQEENKKWITLEKICTFFISADKFIKQNTLLKDLDNIQIKLEQYEKDEITRLLKEHADEIKNYYEKLNPSDDVKFSGIEVKSGARRQAKLVAEAFGKDINPVTFFSEAHTNSLALSIYFPQRVDRNPTWEVLVLDDPVQSMDENHSLALIDILAGIISSGKKQVIVLTHSKSFFNRLRARFIPNKPKVYSFYNNEEKGPSILLNEGETIDHLRSVEDHAKKGDPKSLEIASHQLRKSTESICFEYLLSKGINYNKVSKIQKSGLDSLFAEVEKQGLPNTEISKLKSLLDTSHQDSHAWSVADTTPGNLVTGVSYVQSIHNSYLK